MKTDGAIEFNTNMDFSPALAREYLTQHEINQLTSAKEQNMNDSNAYLSPEVVTQIKAAEKSIANELLLMQREGVPPMYLLTAMSMAIAELITTTIGPDSVAPWFKNSAKMVENLQNQTSGNS